MRGDWFLHALVARQGGALLPVSLPFSDTGKKETLFSLCPLLRLCASSESSSGRGPKSFSPWHPFHFQVRKNRKNPKTSLREYLIFKGGTALKRCYFPDYRFSEDLDFSLSQDLSFEDLLDGLEDVYIQVQSDSGLLQVIFKSVVPSLSFLQFIIPPVLIIS